MYVTYIYRVFIVFNSGFTAAKVLLFCDICKRKVQIFMEIEVHFFFFLPISQSDNKKICPFSEMLICEQPENKKQGQEN